MIHDSLADAARVDIRRSPSGYEAIITPSGAAPVEVDVVPSTASIELKGDVTVATDSCGHARKWTSVVIPRGPSGRLQTPPVFTVTDSIDYSGLNECCRVADPGPTIEPALMPDVVQPVVTAEIDAFRASVHLPWDPVSVSVSEGVDGAALERALTVNRLGPTMPVDMTWNLPVAPAQVSWDAFVRVVGFANDWDFIAGSLIRVNAAPGITDPSGNRSTEYASYSHPIREIGYAEPSFDFETVGGVPSWGDVHHADLGTPDAAACVSGGCLVIGPTTESAGIAGRLTAPSTINAVRIVFRATFTGITSGGGVPLRIELAKPGARAYRWSWTADVAATATSYTVDLPRTFFVRNVSLGTEVGFRISVDADVDPLRNPTCVVAVTSQVAIESITPVY
jgi:hypothetical protein